MRSGYGRGRQRPESEDGREEPGKPVTAEELRQAALGYLSRYAASTAVLRRALVRRAKRGRPFGEALSPETEALVDSVVAAAVKSRLLDDEQYAESRTSSLVRRGDSRRAIRNRLAADGLPNELVEKKLEESGADDAEAALRFARRKRLGPWRTRPVEGRRDKDVAAMMRAGFGYAVACKALDADPDETVVDEDDDGL
jgi:regulatory protein